MHIQAEWSCKHSLRCTKAFVPKAFVTLSLQVGFPCPHVGRSVSFSLLKLQPNYLAMIATDSFGIHSDANYVFDNETIVDRLESAGVTWGVRLLREVVFCYMEQSFPEFSNDCSVQQKFCDHDQHIRISQREGIWFFNMKYLTRAALQDRVF